MGITGDWLLRIDTAEGPQRLPLNFRVDGTTSDSEITWREFADDHIAVEFSAAWCQRNVATVMRWITAGPVRTWSDFSGQAIEFRFTGKIWTNGRFVISPQNGQAPALRPAKEARASATECLHRGEVVERVRLAKCAAGLSIYRCLNDLIPGGTCVITGENGERGVEIARRKLPICLECGERNLVRPEQLELLVSGIDGPPIPRPAGWNRNPHVKAAHAELWRRELAKAWDVPSGFEGRGIVTLMGGTRYFPCGYVMLRALRRLGCTLPVELWYLGPSEMDNVTRHLAEEIPGVRCVDALAELDGEPRILGGWQAKVWAIMRSRFAEVLFLDADHLPLRDPSYLFDAPEYRETGAVLWPDLPNEFSLRVTADAFEVCGLPVPGRTLIPKHPHPTDYCPVESGQVLIDKRRPEQWRALQLCRWMNDHSDFFYPEPRGRRYWYFYGDTATFMFPWLCGEVPHSMAPVNSWIGSGKSGAFIIHDFSGEVWTQHKCQPIHKLRLNGANPSCPGFVHHDWIDEFIGELRQRWTGKLWNWANQSGAEMMQASDLYGDYVPFGIPGLPPRITLRSGGVIAGTDCRWTLRLDSRETLLVLTIHEKAVEILGRDVANDLWCHHPDKFLISAPPAEFDIDLTERHSLAMYWSTTRHNEYRLPERLDGLVIDVGAHVGAAAVELLDRGATELIAVEPDPTNYARLVGNLRRRTDGTTLRAWPIQAGVWSDTTWHRIGWVGEAGGSPGWSIAPEGVTTRVLGAVVRTVTMAEIFRLFPARARLVKLDCEGAEWEAFRDPTWLDRVDAVVGEWHGWNVDRHGREIGAILEAAGFRVLVTDHPSYPGIGHFWGWREGYEFTTAAGY